MLVTPVATVKEFIGKINQTLGQLKPNSKLTKSQAIWLSTVIVGIIMTERLSWALFERRGFDTAKAEALRWMFLRAKICWHSVLRASTLHILRSYGIKEGTIVFDDTDKKRAKTTSKIHGAHKMKDKSTGSISMARHWSL